MLLMGKLTISMAIFNSFLYVYQRVFLWTIPFHSYGSNGPIKYGAFRRKFSRENQSIDDCDD